MVKKLSQYEFEQARWHSGRRGREIDLIILHYTAGRGDEDGLARFFAAGNRKASAHFGVGRGGGVMQMVDIDRNAWHAGKSTFLGKGSVGWRSIGIEICNTGWAHLDRLPQSRIFNGEHRNPRSRSKRWERYTWKQVEAVDKLLRELKEAVPTLKYVAGHDDIRNYQTIDIRGSKTDPGPALPWHVLHTDSIGIKRMAWSFRDEEWYHVPEGTIATH